MSHQVVNLGFLLMLAEGVKIGGSSQQNTPRCWQSTLSSVMPSDPRDVAVTVLEGQCQSPSAERALWGALRNLPQEQQKELMAGAMGSLKNELNKALQHGLPHKLLEDEHSDPWRPGSFLQISRCQHHSHALLDTGTVTACSEMFNLNACGAVSWHSS